MMMMKMLLAVLSVLTMALPAQAAILTYTIDGTIIDGNGFLLDAAPAGTAFRASYTLDDSIGRTADISLFPFNRVFNPGEDRVNPIRTVLTAGSLLFRFGDEASNFIGFNFPLSVGGFSSPDANYTFFNETSSDDGSSADLILGMVNGNGLANLFSFTNTAGDNSTLYLSFDRPVLAAAVPEPATWAFMIVGFGAIGCMLRADRRRRSGGRALAAG